MTTAVSNPAASSPNKIHKRAHHVIEWPLLPDDFVLPDDPVENEVQPLLAAARKRPAKKV